VGRRRLVVTDLDGTLLGDDAALGRFRQWIAADRDKHLLVYATGRHRASYRSVLADCALPRPDAVVTAVGTEIDDEAGHPWPAWSSRFDGWHADRVRAALRPVRWLELQEDAHQSPLKASYRVPGIGRDDLALVRRLLSDAGIVANIVHSGGVNLDILPPLAGKGLATRFLADGWGIPPTDVLAFGDSGNDAEMLAAGFRGTIVANALPELRLVVDANVYQSQRAFADGILDGIRYWAAVGEQEAVAQRSPILKDGPTRTSVG
jgi:sucrose-6F-phosphate phosphohydrolase